MRQILLIAIGLSTALFADFSKNGNIVTDSSTGLQWQDNETVRKTWTESIDYCEVLTLDGHNDWRLPNLKELTSLVDDSRVSPVISTVFEHTASSNYWSSTTNAGLSGVAWNVYFSDGYQYYYGKSRSIYVRCVRAGQ